MHGSSNAVEMSFELITASGSSFSASFSDTMSTMSSNVLRFVAEPLAYISTTVVRELLFESKAKKELADEALSKGIRRKIGSMGVMTSSFPSMRIEAR